MDKSGEDEKIAAAKEANELVAAASFAAIGTADLVTGTPYVSLVAVASSDGAPCLLLSGLARHARNLAAQPRASLLFTPVLNSPSGYHHDPLTEPRVTLLGRIVTSTAPQHRAAFLERHRSASAYADFGDFAFYRLEVDGAHFIGGFGRIIELTAAHLRAARANIR